MSLGKLDKEQLKTAGRLAVNINRHSDQMMDIIADLQVTALQDKERVIRVEDLDEMYAEMMQAVWALQQRWTEWQAK